MIIESIARKGRKAVLYFSDGSYLVLYPDVVYNNGLRKGDEISEAKIAVLKSEDDLIKVQNSAMRMISGRDHSISELIKKLQRKDYLAENINKTIDKMIDLGLLDDYKFTEKFIENCRNSRKFGNSRIKAELFKKGVNKSLIDEILNENQNRNVDKENISILIEKKMKLLSSKNLPSQKIRQRLYQFLAGRGFEFEQIKSAVDKFINDNTEEENYV